MSSLIAKRHIRLIPQAHQCPFFERIKGGSGSSGLALSCSFSLPQLFSSFVLVIKALIDEPPNPKEDQRKEHAVN